jgi:hypothetical protein
MKTLAVMVLAACPLGAAETVRIWRRPLRKTLVGVAVAMALATAAGMGEAQEKRPYTNYGVGLNSCGQFLEARRYPGNDVAYEHWLGGFLTANASWRVGLGAEPANTDVLAAVAWIENYCRQNPLRQFNTAAVALVHHLLFTKEPAVRSAR